MYFEGLIKRHGTYYLEPTVEYTSIVENTIEIRVSPISRKEDILSKCRVLSSLRILSRVESALIARLFSNLKRRYFLDWGYFQKERILSRLGYSRD